MPLNYALLMGKDQTCLSHIPRAQLHAQPGAGAHGHLLSYTEPGIGEKKGDRVGAPPGKMREGGQRTCPSEEHNHQKFNGGKVKVHHFSSQGNRMAFSLRYCYQKDGSLQILSSSQILNSNNLDSESRKKTYGQIFSRFSTNLGQ